MPYNVTIMDFESIPNGVRKCRMALGLTQAELAAQAGISRTAVTAIEGDHLVPSVTAALSLAAALGTTVEKLFGQAASDDVSEVWAWKPTSTKAPCWRAEVAGKTVLYPANSMPMIASLPDRIVTRGASPDAALASETLVMASCDPAAGLLASQFAAVTGLRLIVLPRSSRKAVEMLRDGLVHLAGLHLSTQDDPDRNVRVARSTLENGFQMIRLAQWQEGIAVSPAANLHSVRAVMKAKLSWIGREPGSGARQCLDRLLENRPGPRRVARDHRGVVDAIQSGWADAGVCVQLVSEEAGLVFLPVQEEPFDICYPTAISEDRRIKAFVKVIRSTAFRKLIGDLPGYKTGETGSILSAN